jgi:hypothetical protein
MEHQLDETRTVIVASSWCSIFYFTYIDDVRSNTNQDNVYSRISKVDKIIKLLCGFCLQLLYIRLKLCIFW